MPCIPIMRGEKQVGTVCCPKIERAFYVSEKPKAYWCFNCRDYMIHLTKAFFQEWYGWGFDLQCIKCKGDYTSMW